MTYAEIAKQCNVTLCGGCGQGNHQVGWASPYGTVHWTERRISRNGLRVFLKLVASIMLHHNRGQPLWQKLYEQNTYASRQALKLGYRLPRRLADYDRSRAEADIRRLGTPMTGALRSWLHR